MKPADFLFTSAEKHAKLMYSGSDRFMICIYKDYYKKKEPECNHNEGILSESA